MSYDVVVVGGGIGGLTVAALLSARGISVCLLERQSQVGGCVSRVEFAQHDFDPGFGIYSGWAPGEIHQRIFSELPAPPPEVAILDAELVVRLEDGTDVRLYRDESKFLAELQRAFPECSESAVAFYLSVALTAHDWEQAKVPEGTSSIVRSFRKFLPKASSVIQVKRDRDKAALDYANNTSPRFKAFLDAQLRAFTNTPLDATAFYAASVTLSIPRQARYAIKGGPASLAERLSKAISAAGGKVRLDTPVLRLAYDETGKAVGVDLLSGETVFAKTIVSNLTVWDTYGKLVGLNRTRPDVKRRLSIIQGGGVYVLFASGEETAISRLPAPQMLCAGSWPRTDDSVSEFIFNAASPLAHFAPGGKRPVTITTSADVNEWFTYQSSVDELEQWDQSALEAIWERLHRALPELGADIEPIETANPRTFYDSTRRKLGMVLGSSQASLTSGVEDHRTDLPNLFMVGDTVSEAANLASVSQSALTLADHLTAEIA